MNTARHYQHISGAELVVFMSHPKEMAQRGRVSNGEETWCRSWSTAEGESNMCTRKTATPPKNHSPWNEHGFPVDSSRL